MWGWIQIFFFRNNFFLISSIGIFFFLDEIKNKKKEIFFLFSYVGKKKKLYQIWTKNLQIFHPKHGKIYSPHCKLLGIKLDLPVKNKSKKSKNSKSKQQEYDDNVRYFDGN